MNTTTTPAPKGADIEQYRPGFEAWARESGFKTARRNDPSCADDYFGYETQQRWIVWIAAKRENVSGSSTSTSQGALTDDRILALACAEVVNDFETQDMLDFGRAVEAEVVARCRAEGGDTNPYPCDHPYCECQKDGIDCKALSGNSGAAPGDALDAARYRWLRDPANTEGPSFVAVYGQADLDGIIDSAIAASTTQGDA